MSLVLHPGRLVSADYAPNAAPQVVSLTPSHGYRSHHGYHTYEGGSPPQQRPEETDGYRAGYAAGQSALSRVPAAFKAVSLPAYTMNHLDPYGYSPYAREEEEVNEEIFGDQGGSSRGPPVMAVDRFGQYETLADLRAHVLALRRRVARLPVRDKPNDKRIVTEMPLIVVVPDADPYAPVGDEYSEDDASAMITSSSVAPTVLAPTQASHRRRHSSSHRTHRSHSGSSTTSPHRHRSSRSHHGHSHSRHSHDHSHDHSHSHSRSHSHNHTPGEPASAPIVPRPTSGPVGLTVAPRSGPAVVGEPLPNYVQAEPAAPRAPLLTESMPSSLPVDSYGNVSVPDHSNLPPISKAEAASIMKSNWEKAGVVPGSAPPIVREGEAITTGSRGGAKAAAASSAANATRVGPSGVPQPGSVPAGTSIPVPQPYR